MGDFKVIELVVFSVSAEEEAVDGAVLSRWSLNVGKPLCGEGWPVECTAASRFSISETRLRRGAEDSWVAAKG